VIELQSCRESIVMRFVADLPAGICKVFGAFITGEFPPDFKFAQSADASAPVPLTEIDSVEPAVLLTLPMGNYTAIVRGVGAMPTGLALLEIYPQ